MKMPFGARFNAYSPAAVLRVTGEDALAFLQGQFTQELRHPPGPLCAYGLWLNQKGKVLADSFALRDGDTWWLISVSSPAEAVRERLEAYIIADDVTVEDVTNAWAGWTLVGNEVEERLRSVGVTPPQAGVWITTEGGMLFNSRLTNEASWEWLRPTNAGAPSALSAAAFDPISRDELERLRIAAGIPRIPQELGEGDLPNEGGLEDVAISYSKGCYLGQEVMARLKSMGQVRRRLLRVSGPGAAPACPASLFAGPKKVGELRSAESAGPDGFIGLAMISLLGLEGAGALALSPEGPAVVSVERNLT